METLETFWNSRDLDDFEKKNTVTKIKITKNKFRALCRESENSVFLQPFHFTIDFWTNICPIF
jgi:hypothetical protein